MNRYRESKLIKTLRAEHGYSLVEVMVAIVLLSVAIIPMVGMFDAGLRAATQGSNQDKARTLANKQLETVKNTPYTTVRDTFPGGTGAPPATGLSAGVIESPNQTDADFPGLTYKVRKAYVRLGATEVVEAADARTMMKVTVTVSRGSGASYSATGLVSK